MFIYIHYNEDALPGVHEFLMRVWCLVTPCIACLTSSKKLLELWMVVPPKTIRTPKLFLFNWWTASDSSYVAPPIINTMMSWGLQSQLDLLNICCKQNLVQKQKFLKGSFTTPHTYSRHHGNWQDQTWNFDHNTTTRPVSRGILQICNPDNFHNICVHVCVCVQVRECAAVWWQYNTWRPTGTTPK